MKPLNLKSATEGRADTELAFSDDRAAMEFDDMLDDCEAQTRTGRGPRARAVDDVKAFEDVR
jgi:hypothetical protein